MSVARWVDSGGPESVEATELVGVPAVAGPAWQVPAGALVEWLELQTALVALGRRTPCVGEPEVWFSGGQSARLVEAVEGCTWCPVREVCAAYGVAADERDGVWGGLTPAERRALAGRRR